MNLYSPLRRTVPIVALALLAVVATTHAAKRGTFRATGVATFVSEDPSGNHFVFSHVGRSNPGGDFTGTAVGHTNGTFQKQSATVTFDYGGGNSTQTVYANNADGTRDFLLEGTLST